MRSAAYRGCYRNAAGTQPFSFQIWVEQKAELSFSDYASSCMLKQRFSVSRTVLSSEGASEVVLTLKSIGSSENGPDEYVCKTTEAQHGLACAVLLHSACACVFSLIPPVFRFYRHMHSVCRLRYHEG